VNQPTTSNAPNQDEVLQVVLGMNKIHILFPCPRIFQPHYLPQNFPLLPPSYLPPPSYLFMLTPSLELERVHDLE